MNTRNLVYPHDAPARGDETIRIRRRRLSHKKSQNITLVFGPEDAAQGSRGRQRRKLQGDLGVG